MNTNPADADALRSRPPNPQRTAVRAALFSENRSGIRNARPIQRASAQSMASTERTSAQNLHRDRTEKSEPSHQNWLRARKTPSRFPKILNGINATATNSVLSNCEHHDLGKRRVKDGPSASVRTRRRKIGLPVDTIREKAESSPSVCARTRKSVFCSNMNRPNASEQAADRARSAPHARRMTASGEKDAPRSGEPGNVVPGAQGGKTDLEGHHTRGAQGGRRIGGATPKTRERGRAWGGVVPGERKRSERHRNEPSRSSTNATERRQRYRAPSPSRRQPGISLMIRTHITDDRSRRPPS